MGGSRLKRSRKLQRRDLYSSPYKASHYLRVQLQYEELYLGGEIWYEHKISNKRSSHGSNSWIQYLLKTTLATSLWLHLCLLCPRKFLTANYTLFCGKLCARSWNLAPRGNFCHCKFTLLLVFSPLLPTSCATFFGCRMACNNLCLQQCSHNDQLVCLSARFLKCWCWHIGHFSTKKKCKSHLFE